MTQPVDRPADESAPLPDPTTPLALEPFVPVIRTFLALAELEPGAPAVVLGLETWSYGQLRAGALALADELETLGIGPGDPVAVTGVKCHGLLVAILAVMARAAVLVPIDPLLPTARRREMIEQGGARTLIEAGDDLGGMALDITGLAVTRYGLPSTPALDPDIDLEAAAARLPEIGGDDPAYILFTSGTTGRPKGIVGRQRGLSHFLAWERGATGIGQGDRVAQLTGLSFDVVLRDLFLPLTSGAALHLPPTAPGTSSPAEILAFLAQDRITLIHAVPTIASFWISNVPEGLALPDLRWVLFAGEPLPGALVERWRLTFATPHVGNLYGPTETTLAKCFLEVADPAEHGVQPVGRAIPGAQALVMDGDRLCGPGEMGEIVIRTSYRSLGYLGSDEVPRRPFVPNPARPDDPDDLVYRSGDRGRYREDGTLEIHGRLDDQVKILGVRIEPAEISATLAEHPDVRVCTVVARPDPAGATALVAYVVLERPVNDAGFRSFLADRVLTTKIPRAFIRMDALPRTPNGKVDRSALPAPDWSGRGSRAEHPDGAAAGVDGGATGMGPSSPASSEASSGASSESPSESPSERSSPASGAASLASSGAPDGPVAAIVRIFEELLPVRPIGPDDDLFGLGGHSLMAARLIARIEAETGVRIQVRTLFQHSTPRGLAGYVAREGRGGPGGNGPSPGSAGVPSAGGSPSGAVPTGASSTGAWSTGASSTGASSTGAVSPAIPDSIVPIRPRGVYAPLFIVPGVGSRILFLRHFAARLGEAQPLLALHTRFLDDGRPYERIEDLAARYVRDLKAVRPIGTFRLLGFSYGGLVALEIARQLVAAGEEVEFLGVVDTRLPRLRQHGRWSVPQSVPRRLLNLAALVQPLSPPARRQYLRRRLQIALQNTQATVIGWLVGHLPAVLAHRLPGHPYGPEELEWLATDRAAWRRFEPLRYPGRITYFWAAHSQRPPEVYDHREGWAELAGGGLDVRPIPGSHLTVMVEPLVRSTAVAVRAALDAAASEYRPSGTTGEHARHLRRAP